MKRPRRYILESSGRNQRMGLLVMLAGMVLVFAALGAVYWVSLYIR